ncbi:MAG: hypothetical protein II323_00645 [Tidjanibacter sp.]|nr:hypothetical protein [Tidjanibacter sp.]
MKHLFRILSVMAIVAIGVNLSSCKEPEVEAAKPTVSIEAGEATETTLSFTITSKDADKVRYFCTTDVYTAAGVFNNGFDAAVGTTSITVEELEAGTTYNIYAVAANGDVLSELAETQMATLATEEPEPEPEPDPKPESNKPTVSVEAVDATETSLTFIITSTNADEVHYVAVDEFTLPYVTIDADFVLQAANIAEANTSAVVTMDYREAATKYYVYAAAMKGSEKVLSECVEMYTLEPTYTSSELPTPDYCNVTFTGLTSRDSYSFALSDEAGMLYFTFELFTESGTNGAIPTATYTIGDGAAGEIDLGTITLVANGATLTVSSGSLNVELYGEGKVRLNGEFTLVDNNTVTLHYDGNINIVGTSTGGDNNSEINLKFTSVKAVYTIEGNPGWYEIQLLADDGSMLDLNIYSNPEQNFLCSGFYPTFASAGEAQQMAMGNSWLSTSSFYQDANGLPYAVLAGLDSYVQVSTDMESDNPTDNYSITIALKLKSHSDQKEYLLKATYDGPMGLEVEPGLPKLEISTFYVEIINQGNRHTLNFYGMYTSMIVKIQAESLAEIGGDYVYHDITTGSVTDLYANIYDLKLDGGRIGIKRFDDTADASDEGRVKPYYAFRLEGVTAGGGQYQIVGDWTSFEQPQVY